MDTSRLSRSEYLAVGGAVLLVIAIFLPWYETAAGNAAANIDGATGSLSAWDVHPILRWVLLLLALTPLLLAWIIVRGQEVGWTRGEITAVLAIFGLGLLLYVGVIDRPGEPSEQISLQIGWYLAVVADLLILAGGIRRSGETTRRRRPPGTF
jgi:hypothetical protein